MTSMRRRAISAVTGLVCAVALTAPVAAATPHRWVPRPADTFQYQLSGTIDVTVNATVFDIDAEGTSKHTVDRLHARGRHAICYIDAGSWEPYRADADKYPETMLGKTVDGWADERWVDIRQLSTLKPIIRHRVDVCAAKGFDGVEYDWTDSYNETTGFSLTGADQVRYDRWLAWLAHDRGMSVALKNSGELVHSLLGRFDFAVTEECFQYHECGLYRPFLDANRPVFDVEYTLSRDQFCSHAHSMGVSASRKHLSLSSWRRAC